MEKEKVKDIPSLDQITEDIKKIDISKLFSKGSYIDAHDGFSWKVAIVLDATPTSISIHYEGWADKYNEKNVPLSSLKIAPFRKLTSGYTGQKMQAYRQFKYQKDKMIEIEKSMEEIVTSKFKVEDPVKFTQFFRGELFFYIDSLLSLLQLYSYSKEDTQEILKFLDGVLGMITEWIKTLADIHKYWEIGQNHNLSHLIYPETSVAMASSELLSLLKSFFGMNARCANSFLHFYDTFNEKPKDGQPAEQRQELATSWCVMRFFKSFYDREGIQALVDLLIDPNSRISIKKKYIMEKRRIN